MPLGGSRVSTAAFVRAGYTIDCLSLWDFYPQTVHVEVLAKLSFSTTR